MAQNVKSFFFKGFGRLTEVFFLGFLLYFSAVGAAIAPCSEPRSAPTTVLGVDTQRRPRTLLVRHEATPYQLVTTQPWPGVPGNGDRFASRWLGQVEVPERQQNSSFKPVLWKGNTSWWLGSDEQGLLRIGGSRWGGIILRRVRGLRCHRVAVYWWFEMVRHRRGP